MLWLAGQSQIGLFVCKCVCVPLLSAIDACQLGVKFSFSSFAPLARQVIVSSQIHKFGRKKRCGKAGSRI